jgi:GH24 family phage-related lysozyme (muramidase)
MGHRDVRSNVLAVTAASEGCILYPYDDLAPKVRDPHGRLVPPEYKGGPLHGTLTQGLGHTNAAGHPEITIGDHWTKEYAFEVLNTDLDKYEDMVSADVKVPLNDNQFGALVDFTYNCGRKNLRRLIVKLNTGDYNDVPVRFMQYVKSKGKTLPGLVKRRQADAALWRSYVDVAKQQAQASEVDATPKNVDTPPIKSIMKSREAQGTAATTAINTLNSAKNTIQDVTSQISETTTQINDAKEAIGFTPDWLDYFGTALSSPWLYVGIVGIAIGAYVIYRRYWRLQTELQTEDTPEVQPEPLPAVDIDEGSDNGNDNGGASVAEAIQPVRAS